MKINFNLLIVFTCSSLLLTACDDNNVALENSTGSENSSSDTNVSVNSEPEKISWPCLKPPVVSNIIPGDTVLSDQASLNCFAWQEFIGLNWPTGEQQSATDFGEPNDYSPVVFETYKSNHDLFEYKGEKPPKWSDTIVSDSSALRIMKRTSKFDVDFKNDDIEEAFPFKPAGRAWLADKNGNLVWYEVLINQPEYEYFYKNEFYNSAKQYQAASKGKHLDLPKGEVSGKVGAMELKAAWLTVSDPLNSKWKHYKLTQAQFCSDANTCTPSTVALVGLHIIHKTVSQPSWVWATFEHIDNAPDIIEVSSGPVTTERYNFYDNSCKELDIPAACSDGKSNLKTSCVKNTHPAYALTLAGGKATGDCQPYPIQVVRDYPIPDTNENPVQSTNKAVQSLIKQANSDSVYQYYQLVNVMWNDSTIDENKAASLPLNALSETAFRPNPNAFPVANTTMETYIQDKACIECHSGATIANPENLKPLYASDYSFIFSMAKSHNKALINIDPNK